MKVAVWLFAAAQCAIFLRDARDDKTCQQDHVSPHGSILEHIDRSVAVVNKVLFEAWPFMLLGATAPLSGDTEQGKSKKS